MRSLLLFFKFLNLISCFLHRIQPPNAWHEVYTPDKSVTVGGHFLTYDSLHISEMSRRYDCENPNMVTNQDHPGCQFVLVQMLMGILARDSRGELVFFSSLSIFDLNTQLTTVNPCPPSAG